MPFIKISRKGCAKAWLFLRKCDKKWKQKRDKNNKKAVTGIAKKNNKYYTKEKL